LNCNHKINIKKQPYVKKTVPLKEQLNRSGTADQKRKKKGCVKEIRART
jgi:hypothetical protein